MARITDELREYFGNCYLFRYEDVRERLTAIADRIDIAHKHAIGYVDDRDTETMAENGWVKLPVDADGVPIRVGDVMEFSAFEIEKPVTRMVDGIGQGVFFAWCGERGYQQHEAKRYRHHHEPTVEDVLREFAEKMAANTAMYVAESWDADERDEADAAAISDYASRLRLAGDE